MSDSRFIGYPAGILVREDCEIGCVSPSMKAIVPAPGPHSSVFVNGQLMMGDTDYEWVDGVPVFKFRLKAEDRVMFQMWGETQKMVDPTNKPQRLKGYLVEVAADCEGRTTRPEYVVTSRHALEHVFKKEPRYTRQITVYVGDITVEDMKRWKAEDDGTARKIGELEAEIARLKGMG